MVTYLHVGKDGSSFFNGLDNGSEVIIGEDHIRGFLGDFGTVDTHSNTNMSLLQSGSIIDTITGHSDDLVLGTYKSILD